MRKRAVAILMAFILIVPALTGCVKVVKIGQEGQLTGEVAFNAGDDVAEIWEDQALPALERDAVFLSQLISEAGGDFSSVAGTYGKYSMGTSGELSFVVKGTATVTEVNTTSKVGYLLLSIDDVPDTITLKLQIGTVYKGSAVRDCLDFISYDNYTNQVDWAKISQSIHELIDADIISNLDLDSISGKQIDFTGCFTVDKQDELLITPVTLTVH